MPRRADGQRGQATVETVALLPLLALLALAAWQAAVAGQAAWLAASAARAAARAAAIGADAEGAARRALPPGLERGLRVERGGAGDVVVRVQLRSVIAGRRLATLTAHARFPDQQAGIGTVAPRLSRPWADVQSSDQRARTVTATARVATLAARVRFPGGRA